MSPRSHGHDENGALTMPSWQGVIEEKIAEARERGEFDDLPGTGRPLRIKENPFAGDWELAFHVLENAEMAPPWMEMSREVREGTAALERLRQRTAAYLAEQLPLARAAAAPPSPPPVPRRRWWQRLGFWAPAPPMTAAYRVSLAALEAERQRSRRAYLAQAARLDEVIAAYNAWLPDELRRLHKPRLTPERAAREFDVDCPPISDADFDAAWSGGQAEPS